MGKYIAALDVGGTKTICALFDSDLRLLTSKRFPTPRLSAEEYFALATGELMSLAKENGIATCDITGIGITLPGMVDGNGRLIYAPFVGWRDTDVAAICRRLTGIEKVVCECDVNACAAAEAIIGGYGDLLWITVSTGIGGGIVSEGRLYRGDLFVAGEIGHTKVEYENPRPCSCGQLGCAEAHASGTALGRRAAAVAASDPEFAAAFSERGLDIDARSLSVLAKAGDSKALALFDEAGDYLGRAISYALNLCNPAAVFIGGGMAESLELLLPSIRRRIQTGCIEAVRETPILKTKLGYEAALIGAAMLTQQKL